MTANNLMYCETNKMHYVLLGYFGTNVCEIWAKANEFASIVGVQIETVRYDQILQSRRYLYHMYMFSTQESKPMDGVRQVDNVFCIFVKVAKLGRFLAKLGRF